MTQAYMLGVFLIGGLGAGSGLTWALCWLERRRGIRATERMIRDYGVDAAKPWPIHEP